MKNKQLIPKKQNGEKVLKYEPVGDLENVNLELVTVKPEEWQLDFKQNFANKDIRLELYKELLLKGKRPLNLSPELLSEYLEARVDLLTNSFDQADFNTLLKYHNNNINDGVRRMYNVWKDASKSKTEPLTGRRDHMSPFTNTIYTNTLKGMIAELAHPIQSKYGVNDFLTNLPLTFDGESIKRNRYLYNVPTHYEYETHKVISPMLRDYIFNGVDYKPRILSNDYLEQVRSGNWEKYFSGDGPEPKIKNPQRITPSIIPSLLINSFLFKQGYNMLNNINRFLYRLNHKEQ